MSPVAAVSLPRRRNDSSGLVPENQRKLGALPVPGGVRCCQVGDNPRGNLMIDLYGMGSPNVVKIYIALEELELPYTVHPIDVFGGKQFSAEFLKLNPNAKVP